MKILAFDLSTTRASIAWRDGKTDCVQEWPNDRKSSSAFFEAVGALAAQFGKPDRIVVGLGPGSYAGTRIAISAAIGLQAASGAELCGYPSICVLAGGDDDYIAVGDARRHSFYFASIANREVVDEINLYDVAEFEEHLAKINAGLPVFSSDALPQFPSVQRAFPSAEMLARIAESKPAKLPSAPLQPIYLRDAHVTFPRPIGTSRK